MGYATILPNMDFSNFGMGKVTTPTPGELTLLQTALNDSDIGPKLSNYNIKYQIAGETTIDGTSIGTAVSQPITSLSDDYFVLFDVTFGLGNSSRSRPCLFARLADNGNFQKMTQSQSLNFWQFRGTWSEDDKYINADITDGNRYKVFMCFYKSTGQIYLKNMTTGYSNTVGNCSGGGTIRTEVYLYGGTVSDNNFDGNIHDFIIGTL